MTDRRIAAEIRAAYAGTLARLLPRAGTLAAAEDALQGAVVRALETWPQNGIPDSAQAWLLTAARNQHVDRMRRQRREDLSEDALTTVGERYPEEPAAWSFEMAGGWDDDLLRLLFTCCHPALAAHERVALTLNTLVGLSCAELARAFLVPPRTMEQRLPWRSRKKRISGVAVANWAII